MEAKVAVKKGFNSRIWSRQLGWSQADMHLFAGNAAKLFEACGKS